MFTRRTLLGAISAVAFLTAAGGVSAQENYDIALISKGFQHQFWQAVKAGADQAAADVTKPMAYNQGFYNLFLAIAVFVGIAFAIGGSIAIGATLVITGTASMAAAALVLALSSPDKIAAALKQGVVPALGIVVLAIGLAL